MLVAVMQLFYTFPCRVPYFPNVIFYGITDDAFWSFYLRSYFHFPEIFGKMSIFTLPKLEKSIPIYFHYRYTKSTSLIRAIELIITNSNWLYNDYNFFMKIKKVKVDKWTSIKALFMSPITDHAQLIKHTLVSFGTSSHTYKKTFFYCYSQCQRLIAI